MSLVEREKRQGLHLPVEVRGEDAGGARFTEYTRTVNVSGRGICFESHRNVAVGARLRLSIELPVNLRRHFGDKDVYQRPRRRLPGRALRGRGGGPHRGPLPGRGTARRDGMIIRFAPHG